MADDFNKQLKEYLKGGLFGEMYKTYETDWLDGDKITGFRENDRVRIEGLNDIGVIIDARPDTDIYVVDFNINSVGYFKASEMTLVDRYITESGICVHEFKEYHGFSENYRYCVKCDEKEK